MKQACLLNNSRAAVRLLLFGCGLASGQDLMKTLHGIEDRYNSANTLRVNFSEILTGHGGRHVPQTGTLYLRKPGQMRWEYTSPAGDLFVSDGKFTYDYIAKGNSYDQQKLKEGDDLRGPLAFLLGKLDFDRDFGQYRTGDADGAITAVPKSDKLEYSEVTLVPGPDFSIRKLSIKGQDGSVIQYVFDGEIRNPSLSENLFKFVKPPGAVLVDSARGNQ
jgi:outer membrane lipoprotein carrier protein